MDALISWPSGFSANPRWGGQQGLDLKSSRKLKKYVDFMAQKRGFHSLIICQQSKEHREKHIKTWCFSYVSVGMTNQSVVAISCNFCTKDRSLHSDVRAPCVRRNSPRPRWIPHFNVGSSPFLTSGLAFNGIINQTAMYWVQYHPFFSLCIGHSWGLILVWGFWTPKSELLLFAVGDSEWQDWPWTFLHNSEVCELNFVWGMVSHLWYP